MPIHSHAEVTVRPVTRGAMPPLKSISPAPGKMCWTLFKTIAHSLKYFVLSENSSPPLVSQAGCGPGHSSHRQSWCANPCHSHVYQNESGFVRGLNLN